MPFLPVRNVCTAFICPCFEVEEHCIEDRSEPEIKTCFHCTQLSFFVVLKKKIAKWGRTQFDKKSLLYDVTSHIFRVHVKPAKIKRTYMR